MTAPTFGRVIGRILGDFPGPTLLVTTLIHGNELAGAIAAERVLARLRSEEVSLRGELVVLGGNLGAMREGRRHRGKDLNRLWTEEKIAALRARDGEGDDAEDHEQRELLTEIDAVFARAAGKVFAIDLHTTSAAGYPFGIYDTRAQEAFALRFPLPMIRGLAAALAGVLTSHLVRRGAIALAVEGGQHDDPRTTDHLEATLVVALEAAGLASASQLSTLASARAHLDAARGGIPRAMEVVARYAITPDDRFKMAPGFANIARVHRGQLLANDAGGEIRAPAEGLVILPLYQGQGDDGFFFGREVSPHRP